VATSITLDSNNHPITQVIDCPGIQLLRYHRGFTDAEHEAFLAAASRDMAVVRKGARFVMIVDVNKASQGSSLQRQRQAEWQEQHAAYFKTHVICAVFVAGSAVLRGALRAVSWFKPFPYPIEIEDDIEPAITTALAALRKAGEPEPTAAQLELLRQAYR
jgi:hypothetical protein